MLVMMTKWATLEEIDAVVAAIETKGYTAVLSQEEKG